MLKVSISLAILSEIFIQIGNYSRSYVRKQKWMFFLNTVYMMNSNTPTTVVRTQSSGM